MNRLSLFLRITVSVHVHPLWEETTTFDKSDSLSSITICPFPLGGSKIEPSEPTLAPKLTIPFGVLAVQEKSPVAWATPERPINAIAVAAADTILLRWRKVRFVCSVLLQCFGVRCLTAACRGEPLPPNGKSIPLHYTVDSTAPIDRCLPKAVRDFRADIRSSCWRSLKTDQGRKPRRLASACG